ncbi:MAG: LuxR family transcriptional regulator [Myxococcales bacterium]|nr:LuxR family transcriptional regulator [Myxococcales bacterium]
MSDRPDHELRRTLLGALLFVLIGGIIGSDLLFDYLHGAGPSHLGLEGTIVLLALGGGVAFSRRWLVLRRDAEELRAEARALRGEAAQLEARLADQRAEAERWRNEARDLIEGLGAAIDRQFERWGLSPAEREIGLLLLKGLSHQEVADLRGVSERTVRQQARSLYKKAGLSGRADLAAYFLEDLLVPRTPVKSAEAEP